METLIIRFLVLFILVFIGLLGIWKFILPSHELVLWRLVAASAIMAGGLALLLTLLLLWGVL